MEQHRLSTSHFTAIVERFYDAFPYPYYPLLAKPRWQDGYLGASGFAGALANRPGRRGISVLSAGSGEILPYVLRQLEPRKNRLTCVDLSARSLRRARFRLLTSTKTTTFVVGDLDVFLDSCHRDHRTFDHVDAFGVLHHLGDPEPTIKRLAAAMSAGATARVMVYNSPARRWITCLQKAFVDLGLSPYSRRDRAAARLILDHCAQCSPSLKDRLDAVGGTTLSNEARLADTFFHVRELCLPPSRWWQLFSDAGFQVIGLYDRYGEWDDLPNPLWQVPSVEAIQARSRDGRFEGNLELMLVKTGPVKHPPAKQTGNLGLLRMMSRLAPSEWFTFPETTSIPLILRQRIWWDFVKHTWGGRSPDIGPWANRLSFAAIGRLARLGAILPGQIHNQKIHSAALAPLEAPSPAPVRPDAGTFSGDAWSTLLLQAAAPGRVPVNERVAAALRRFQDAARA